MGANNSAPQTARIENPESRITVQVSPSVVTRIENAQNQDEEKLDIKTLHNAAVRNLEDLQEREHQTSIRQYEQEQQQKQQQSQQEQSMQQPEHQKQQQQQQQPYENKGRSYGQQSYEKKSDEQRSYQHSYTHNLNQRRDRENGIRSPGEFLDGGKYNQYEDRQFSKCMANLENYLSRPVQWTNNIDGKILELRNELIACHRKHPGEPLCCAELAEKYQDLIFREQFLSILRFNRKSDEEGQDQDRDRDVDVDGDGGGDADGDGNGDGDDEEQSPKHELSEEQTEEINYCASQN